jgi:hypothetical protein
VTVALRVGPTLLWGAAEFLDAPYSAWTDVGTTELFHRTTCPLTPAGVTLGDEFGSRGTLRVSHPTGAYATMIRCVDGA